MNILSRFLVRRAARRLAQAGHMAHRERVKATALEIRAAFPNRKWSKPL